MPSSDRGTSTGGATFAVDETVASAARSGRAAKAIHAARGKTKGRSFMGKKNGRARTEKRRASTKASPPDKTSEAD
jgi:hypothetical protein